MQECSQKSTKSLSNLQTGSNEVVLNWNLPLNIRNSVNSELPNSSGMTSLVFHIRVPLLQLFLSICEVNTLHPSLLPLPLSSLTFSSPFPGESYHFFSFLYSSRVMLSGPVLSAWDGLTHLLFLSSPLSLSSLSFFLSPLPPSACM